MVNSIQLNFLSKAQDIFLSINNITHTRRFVHAFLTGKFYSVKISVTFFVTESPSYLLESPSSNDGDSNKYDGDRLITSSSSPVN